MASRAAPPPDEESRVLDGVIHWLDDFLPEPPQVPRVILEVPPKPPKPPEKAEPVPVVPRPEPLPETPFPATTTPEDPPAPPLPEDPPAPPLPETPPLPAPVEEEPAPPPLPEPQPKPEPEPAPEPVPVVEARIFPPGTPKPEPPAEPKPKPKPKPKVEPEPKPEAKPKTPPKPKKKPEKKPAPKPEAEAKPVAAPPPPADGLRIDLTEVLGTPLPEEAKNCIDRHQGHVRFCLRNVQLPGAVAPLFQIGGAKTATPKMLARYDGGKLTHLHGSFVQSGLDAVVDHFQALHGPPLETLSRIVTPFEGRPTNNPTFLWRKPAVVNGIEQTVTLEIRQFDDTRGGFPDMHYGLVRLYGAHSLPIFPRISPRDVMLLRFSVN